MSANAISPKVFRDLSQQALDAAYDQALYAPNLEQLRLQRAARSNFARERLGPAQRLAYGESAIEALDLYAARCARPVGRTAPLHVFVHGGAWRSGRAADYAFLAEAFVQAGVHFAVLDFVSVDDANGDLRPMAAQIRRAIAWLWRHADSLGADPGRIYLSGHSSGAHLAGVALVTNWAGEHGIAARVLQGATLVSGMYDMEAVRLSSRRRYLAFDDDMEARMSVQRQIARIQVPVVLGYGSLETPEFRRQTLEFAQALREAGKDVECIEALHYNHFEVLDAMANPYGYFAAAALRQMGVAPQQGG